MGLMEAQSISVKRAQVEFHNFAAMGELERCLKLYAERNAGRATVLRNHSYFIGPFQSLTPFLEIGANAGHTSYMLANEFDSDGFALDISADALRHGRHLMEAWKLKRAPVRMAGDAVNLPFADESLRFVCTFQTLSQFMDIDAVFREVARVLQPGGVFLFAEEPLLRKLSLRLYRCPYYESMKPWERKLHDWGLLGYLVRDVIGADQEESFGIRQNHTMSLAEWDALGKKYFPAREYEAFVPERGWGEKIVKWAAPTNWWGARLLGGTLVGILKKAGSAPPTRSMDDFAARLRCPDCHAALILDQSATLHCENCAYQAQEEEGVYNLLPSPDRSELYPGDRDDIIDFSVPGHERRLLGDWHKLEGGHGSYYRWIGARAEARLHRVKPGPQRLRIRSNIPPQAVNGQIRVVVNGSPLKTFPVERAGLLVLEADMPVAEEYLIEIHASPVWSAPSDPHALSVMIGMIRLVPAQR